MRNGGNIFWRGTAALEAFRFADAATDYDRALERRADLPEAYLNRAIARIGLKEYASAVADLDRLEKDGAPLPRLFFIRETAKRLAGDAAGADADRAAGLARTPTDAAGWNARGESRLRSIPPDASGALADFDAAVDLDPGFWPGWQSRAHVLSEHLGKPEEAVLALDRADEIQPDAVPSLAGRAVLLARLGKSKAARADAARCLVLDESALTLYQVACVDSLTARTAADRAAAITHLRAAVRKDATWASGMPTDPDLKAVKDEADFRALMAAAGELTRDR